MRFFDWSLLWGVLKRRYFSLIVTYYLFAKSLRIVIIVFWVLDRHHSERTFIQFQLLLQLPVYGLSIRGFDELCRHLLLFVHDTGVFLERFPPYKINATPQIMARYIKYILRFSMYIFLLSTLYPLRIKVTSIVDNNKFN